MKKPWGKCSNNALYSLDRDLEKTPDEANQPRMLLPKTLIWNAEDRAGILPGVVELIPVRQEQT